MAKKINKVSKIELIGGQAKPGPLLASCAINMGEFTRQFNDRTKNRAGEVVPTIITAYIDKSFIFELKTTPTTQLLKKAANIEKGSQNSTKNIVATITADDVKKIAEYKLIDSTANDINGMFNMIAGTALQMGIKIKDFNPKIKSKK